VGILWEFQLQLEQA